MMVQMTNVIRRGCCMSPSEYEDDDPYDEIIVEKEKQKRQPDPSYNQDMAFVIMVIAWALPKVILADFWATVELGLRFVNPSEALATSVGDLALGTDTICSIQPHQDAVFYRDNNTLCGYSFGLGSFSECVFDRVSGRW